MGEGHLDLIRRGHDGFNRADLSETEDIVTDDVVWGTTGRFPGMEGVYHGPDALGEWMRLVRSEWEEFSVSLEEVLGETDDKVAVVERLWGRGRESGAEAEMRVFSVYRFSGGRMARRDAFNSRDEALAALERG